MLVVTETSTLCVKKVFNLGPGPEVIKLFSCSAQVRLKFILLINVNKSRINYNLWQSQSEISTSFDYYCIYEQFNFHAQLS